MQKLSWPARLATGMAFSAFAIVLHLILAIWTGDRLPFLLFVPTVAMSAIVFGYAPSYIVFATGLLYGAWLLPPRGDIAVADHADQLSLSAFAVVCLLFIYVGGWMRRTSQRAAQSEQKLSDERALAQKAMQTYDARFRAVLQASGVPFCILAPVRDESRAVVDFSWAYLNAAAESVYGRAAGSLIGRHVADELPAIWNAPGVFDHFVAVVEHGETRTFDLEAELGAARWFHLVASPLEGMVAAWFADVTLQKQNEQALREADRRKDEFLATLAHELRNPIAPIRMAAALLKLPNVSEPAWRKTCDVIERQSATMALLLDDLLDVSRISRGSLSLRRDWIALRDVFDAAIETARPLIDSKGHRLKVDLPEPAPHLLADPLRLAQVVANLLTNAAKYTDPGGMITLTGGQADGEVTMEVKDTGIGIAPGQVDSIFEMFSQVHGAHDRSKSGLGIGLALCRGLVELHGGSIAAYSDGPGRGSRFVARVPVGQAPLGADMAGAARPAAASVPRKILIADDNRDAADTMAAVLELAGHRTLVTYDGVAALEAFGDFEPDIVLLDIGMPRLSGLEVARRIRDTHNGRHVKLVAVTGWGQAADKARTAAAGFDVHLTKPVSPAQVTQLLE